MGKPAVEGATVEFQFVTIWVKEVNRRVGAAVFLPNLGILAQMVVPIGQITGRGKRNVTVVAARCYAARLFQTRGCSVQNNSQWPIVRAAWRPERCGRMRWTSLDRSRKG